MRTLSIPAASILTAAALCVGWSSATELALQEEGGASEEARAEALSMFRARCTACHQPPDPRFTVDRAWLHQLADTA